MRLPISQRSIGPIVAFVAAMLLSSAPTRAGLTAKTYEFKANTTLEIGLDLGAGLRLDSIEIIVPERSEGGVAPLMSQPKAKVRFSNLSDGSARLGIAIAVLDAEGRLVAAGSGGTRMFPLRSERQIAYTVPFDDVNAAIGGATAFMISIETSP